jgi:hypothetical protein
MATGVETQRMEHAAGRLLHVPSGESAPFDPHGRIIYSLGPPSCNFCRRLLRRPDEARKAETIRG